MAEIPPEIWANVAQQARRDLPPVGKPGVTWKDLHQHDLTTMMRVSKTFHKVTASVLYSEIVVDNPAGLLEGIGKEGYNPTSPTDQESPSAPIHKRHLLAKVHTAHYVYSTADSEVYGSGGRVSLPGEDMLARANAMRRDLSMCETKFEFDALQARKQVLEHEALQEILASHDYKRYVGQISLVPHPMSLAELFPALQRRTICAWAPAHWWSSPEGVPYPQGQDGYDVTCRAVYSIQDHLAQTVPIPTGRHLCQDACRGPLILHFRPGPAVSIETNVMHDIPVGRDLWRSLLPGIENRLDINPTGDLLKNHPLARSEDPFDLVQVLMASWLHILRMALDHVDDDDPDPAQQTTIKLVLPHKRARSIDEASSSADDQKLRDIMVYFKEITGYSDMDKWSDRISFVWEDDVPPCPACGKVGIMQE